MTFQFISVKKYFNSKGAKASKEFAHYICNYCNDTFSGKAKSKLISQELHFCSSICFNLASRKGGILFEKRKQNSLTELGLSHKNQNYILSVIDEGKNGL